MFDDGGAGRTIHTVYAQTFMHIALAYRRAGRSGQLADFRQADALGVVMQTQPRLAVFADDVRRSMSSLLSREIRRSTQASRSSGMSGSTSARSSTSLSATIVANVPLRMR